MGLFSSWTLSKMRQFKLRPTLNLLLFLFISFSGWSVELKQQISHFELVGANIEVFFDKNRTFTASNLPLSKFEKYTKLSPNFGFYDGVVWLKFKLDSPRSRKMILELKNPTLDFVEVFKKTKSGFTEISYFGEGFPFAQRKIEHRLFQVDINVPSEILLRVNNFGAQCFVPIHLYDDKGLEIRDFRAQFLWGIYFGMLLFVFVLTLTVFIMLRKRSTFYYLIYLLSISLVQISFSGFGTQYLWPNSPFFSNRAILLMGSLSVIFSVLFTINFLKTKEYSKKIHLFFNFTILVVLLNVCIAFSNFSGAYSVANITINLLIVVVSIMTIPVSIGSINRGFKPAIYFLLSFSVLIVSVVIFTMRNFGILPGNLITEFSLQIGSGLEVVLLTLGVIQEFKSLKDNALTTLGHIKIMKEQESEGLEKEVQIRTTQVLQNKIDIEIKNKKVLSSIKYAKGIQDILVSTEVEFIAPFASGFVFNQPKDIVSGDFIWNSKITKLFNGEETELEVFCLGDCTGHGVPGAVISVLSIRILNSALKIPQLNGPADILDFLQEEFRLLFKRAGSSLMIQDGMDCIVCVFNPKTNVLQMAGAKNGIYLVDNGELRYFGGNRFEIGGSRPIAPYEQINIQLKKGNRLYFTTDGFADQFGGTNDKKMKLHVLKKLLIENFEKPMKIQKKFYTSYFNNWKREYEQTDDICLVGLEI